MNIYFLELFGTCNSCGSIWSFPVFSREMSFPLNGFRIGTQAVNSTQSSKTVRSDEDWPNWSDTEEADKDKGQSVQISHQSTGLDSSVVSAKTGNDSEEPWDDFEDSEVTSDQSPSTQLPVSIPKRSMKNTAQSLSEPTAGPQKLSKALKLNSNVKSPPDHNHTSWDTSWDQGTDTSKPNKTSLASEPKPKNTNKSHGVGGLGEEFTIAVKRKREQDPELDFFADMVPDIKLSSTSLLLPVESAVGEPITATVTRHTTSDDADLSIDALKLTAKFAAADLTEVTQNLVCHAFIIILKYSKAY